MAGVNEFAKVKLQEDNVMTELRLDPNDMSDIILTPYKKSNVNGGTNGNNGGMMLC